MNRWLALAKQPDTGANPRPDTLTKPDKRGFCQVLSGCRVDKSQEKSPYEGAQVDPPRAVSVTGQPLTWTGRVVRLDEWRSLSAWDHHGPDGRLFCGHCRAWVAAGGCPHCGESKDGR